MDGALFSGSYGIVSPAATESLLQPSAVSFRGKATDLDLGLLNIMLLDDNPALVPASLSALLATVPTAQPLTPGFALLPPDQIVQVPGRSIGKKGAGPWVYQEATVAAVAQAFAILQGKGQYGPYALVLQTTPFADAHSPLATTLITPAEPIRHLMTAGFYGTGTLPPYQKSNAPPSSGPVGAKTPGQQTGLPTFISAGNPSSSIAPVGYTGLVVSLGGNTMDLVRGEMQDGEDVIVRFEQKDVDGNYRFRVVERFALRLKDLTAVVMLAFEPPTNPNEAVT